MKRTSGTRLFRDCPTTPSEESVNTAGLPYTSVASPLSIAAFIVLHMTMDILRLLHQKPSVISVSSFHLAVQLAGAGLHAGLSGSGGYVMGIHTNLATRLKDQNTEVKTRQQTDPRSCTASEKHIADPSQPTPHAPKILATLLHFSFLLSIFPPHTVAQVIRVAVYPQQTPSDPVFTKCTTQGTLIGIFVRLKRPARTADQWGKPYTGAFIRKDGEALETQVSPFLDGYVLHRVVHPMEIAANGVPVSSRKHARL